MFKFQALPALCAAAALLLSACASTPNTARSGTTPTPPKARGDDSRFEMTQNGRRMSADDFDAWMKSRGIRIAQGPGGAKPEVRTAKPRSRSQSRTATAPTAVAKPQPVAVASTVAPRPTAAKPGASAKPAAAVKPKAASGVAAAPKPTAAAATRPATSAKPKPKGSGSSCGL